MATIRIITANKKASETVETVEALLAEAYPDWRVENLVEENGEWKARLIQAAGEPPAFLKKKDEEGLSDDADAPDDGGDDDGDDDSDAPDDDGDEPKDSDEPKGDKKEKGKGDPVKEVQKVIDELQGLLSDLGGKTQELQNAHDEKADKLKEIGDTVGDEGSKAEVTPDEIGPTPGGPEGLDGPPSGAIPPIPKRPGVPSGAAPMPGAPSTFASKRRRTEIATHPGFDASGNRMTLTAAMAELESDPRFRGYKVEQARQEGDKFVAKLQLKR